MIRLRVLELLKEQGKTKYSVNKQLGMSHQNFSRMVNNETKSIRYEAIEELCLILNCTPNDLFEFDFTLPEKSAPRSASRKQAPRPASRRAKHGR